MKRTSRLILVAMLIVFSFLSGFTYRDIGTGDGVHGFVTTMRLLPARLASAATVGLEGNRAHLSPVETYWSVFTYLDSNYYGKKPEPKALTYAAIRGMLGSLGDRYTRFLDPDEYKEMQQENRGDFEGIGAVLDTEDGRVFIKKPIKNSPAIRAGLKANDIILRVDEQLIQGLSITEVVKLIRGPPRTKVKLTIKREEVPEPFDVEIERDIIPFEIVEAKMEDDVNKIGRIILRQFNEKSNQQFDEALNELESKGIRGLILDLRGNPGGLLDVAVDIGSRFIRKGDIVIIQDKGGRRRPHQADRSKYTGGSRPLAVLVDHGSASASEIVAGAIQDHKAGILIGTETFGKGLVQTIINLQGGEAVSITTAKYLTPAGHDPSKDKIHPDIVVEPSDEDLKNDNDVQLKRAVQAIKERLGATQATSQNERHGKS